MTFLNGIFLLFAYLDPGSGSVLLQMIIAGLLGFGLAVRLFWGRIKGFFGGSIQETSDDEDNEVR